jgi:hypothetical protein
VGWGKRDIPTETDTIGLQFPTGSVVWAQPSPPTYISWGKRQDDAEPTDAPEIPDDEFPEDPEDPEGPVDIPPFPVPTQPNSIGIQPPTATVIWGKRQDEGLPTDFPLFPEPTPTDEVSNSPPSATVIWG